jgi:hypothetical protein
MVYSINLFTFPPCSIHIAMKIRELHGEANNFHSYCTIFAIMCSHTYLPVVKFRTIPSPKRGWREKLRNQTSHQYKNICIVRVFINSRFIDGSSEQTSGCYRYRKCCSLNFQQQKMYVTVDIGDP